MSTSITKEHLVGFVVGLAVARVCSISRKCRSNVQENGLHYYDGWCFSAAIASLPTIALARITVQCINTENLLPELD